MEEKVRLFYILNVVVASVVAFRQLIFNKSTRESYSSVLGPVNAVKAKRKWSNAINESRVFLGQSIAEKLVDNSSHTIHETLVPNIVHYIWVDFGGVYKFTFLNAVSFISVHKNWKPDEILVHVNNNNRPHGQWWDYVTSHVTTKIRFLEYNMSQIDIFGEKPKYVEHIADIMRLRVLKEYGGTYLDSDVIALRSLAPLRRYDHTQGVGAMSSGLSNGVIIAKKSSKFLDIWLEEYKMYGKEHVRSLWSYYSIERPRQLLKRQPELVRIEKDTLVRPLVGMYRNMETRQNVWKYSYSMHVWKRKTFIPERPDQIKLISNQSLLRDVMEYVVFNKIPFYAKNDRKAKKSSQSRKARSRESRQ
ncbi:unnamed protein product [Owenia fusiformis]|uniref:Uncharacterized protein n=1 Tax=Owenia fusiformis TaxID=6347 RepID=A0A8J1U0R4_OWEFU|nr:unnamed protein product [Owenia fusiformis]